MNTVGIDVGGSFVKWVAATSGVVVAQDSEPLPTSGVFDYVGDLALRLARAHGAHSLGLGLAGLVRWPKGEFVWGPHVEGKVMPYREKLTQLLGIPVAVDNDANLAAYAEAIGGAGQNFNNVVMLTFGTGIGSGIVIGGEIYRGGSFAGEVGHMTMQPGGSECACGGWGCWETLVSGGALDRASVELARRLPAGTLAKVAVGMTPTAAHLTTAADLGDAQAGAILANAGEWLGRGVANLIVVLDPDVVVVGGAAAEAGERLLAPARMAITSHLAGAVHRNLAPLVVAKFGKMSGSVGAALLAGRMIEQQPEEQPEEQP